MTAPLENNRRRILVVDDDNDTRRIVRSALEHEGYTVDTAGDGVEALKKINDWKPHLTLLDVEMPGLNGLETLKKLREKDEYMSALFLSGLSRPGDVIQGLDAGADDYIRKPFDVTELLARIRSQLRIKDLNDELKRANEKLKALVDIDDLTGLFNMRSLYKKLDFEIERASRYRRSVCVMMMDMDHFKKVNDNNDHLFGSFVLSEVGRLIRDNMRKVDFAARYGGDEFLIALTETDVNGAKAFSERLRSLIEQKIFKNENYSIQLTASIGFAICSPSVKFIDAKSLVREADRALYEAKTRGRNRVEFFNLSEE